MIRKKKKAESMKRLFTLKHREKLSKHAVSVKAYQLGGVYAWRRPNLPFMGKTISSSSLITDARELLLTYGEGKITTTKRHQDLNKHMRSV